MRVSLQIDGDAKGAEEAAEKTSAAIGELGKQTDEISKAIEAGFNKAVGAMTKLGESTSANGTANDNFKGKLLGVVGSLDSVAQKAAGADSALGKTSTGIVNVAKGVAGLSVGAGAIGLLSGAFGIAATAAGALYAVMNSGSEAAAKRIGDATAHINAANAAYRNATKAADGYYQKANAIAILDSTLNLKALRKDEAKDSATAANVLTPSTLGIISGSIPGEAGMANGLAGALFPDQANDKFRAFQTQIDALNASIAAGAPAWEKFRIDVAMVGNAAEATNPAIAAAAKEINDLTKKQGNRAEAISEEERNLRFFTNTQTKADLTARGITATTNENAGAFDRMTKAIARQAAGLEAEAASTGKSVGEAAKMRAEFQLQEGATQAGIKLTGAYADQVDKLASRFGAATQKAAEFRLASDLKFEAGQLGRTTDEAGVADRLRGVYGDNVESVMNGAAAGTIRFNNELKELKATSMELSQGVFRDFRNELQQGTTAWDAFGKAGVNALGRIADKLADKALDSVISSIFGSFKLGGSGGIGAAQSLGSTGFSLTGTGGLFAEGGYTGAGAKYQPAGIVHAGEFVFSQQRTSQLGVGYLDRLHRGYADGGLVTPAGSAITALNRAPQPSGVSGSNSGERAVRVDVAVSVDQSGNLQAYVKNVSQQSASDVVNAFATDPSFVNHVSQAAMTGRQQGKM
jgi:hypothetical protein